MFNSQSGVASEEGEREIQLYLPPEQEPSRVERMYHSMPCVISPADSCGNNSACFDLACICLLSFCVLSAMHCHSLLLGHCRAAAVGFTFRGSPKHLKKSPPKKRLFKRPPKTTMLFVGGRKNPTCAAEGVFFRSAGPRRGVGGRSDLRFLSVCDLNKKKLCFFL